METMAVAEVCRRRQTPLLAVRVISDAADEDLPGEVEKLLRSRRPRAAGRRRRLDLQRPGAFWTCCG